MDLQSYKERRERVWAQFEPLTREVAHAINKDRILYVDLTTRRVVVQARQKMIAQLQLLPNTRLAKWTWAHGLQFDCVKVKHQTLAGVCGRLQNVAAELRRRLVKVIDKKDFLVRSVTELDVLKSLCVAVYGFDTVTEVQLGPDPDCMCLIGLCDIHVPPAEHQKVDDAFANGLAAIAQDQVLYETTGHSTLRDQPSQNGIQVEGICRRHCSCPQCPTRSTNDYTKLRRCARCRRVEYCSVECQHLHWPAHKQECSDQSLSGLEAPGTSR